MSKISTDLRGALNHSLDALEMVSFGEGYEAAVAGLDELSNIKHNEGDTVAAEVLRWAANDLRGEHC